MTREYTCVRYHHLFTLGLVVFIPPFDSGVDELGEFLHLRDVLFRDIGWCFVSDLVCFLDLECFDQVGTLLVEADFLFLECVPFIYDISKGLFLVLGSLDGFVHVDFAGPFSG